MLFLQRCLLNCVCVCLSVCVQLHNSHKIKQKIAINFSATVCTAIAGQVTQTTLDPATPTE